MNQQPTGHQYEISHGRYTAVLTEVGANLRSLSLDGRELLWTFEAHEAPLDYQGAQLAPWPNRIADGRYDFDGQEHQVPINEPERHTALHGLVHDKSFELVEHTSSSVTQRVLLTEEDGWPFRLLVEIRHGLGDDGLLVDVTAANVGDRPLPYGYGVHPYFAFPLDQLTLELPFNRELLVDPDRLLPLEIAPVTAEHDFTSARPLGDAVFDTAFTAPRVPHWEVGLVGPEHTVRVWGDASTPWVQVFTHPDRHTIAVEPMTCGPDAFNPGPTRGERIVLTPGESTACRWGVRGE